MILSATLTIFNHFDWGYFIDELGTKHFTSKWPWDIFHWKRDFVYSTIIIYNTHKNSINSSCPMSCSIMQKSIMLTLFKLLIWVVWVSVIIAICLIVKIMLKIICKNTKKILKTSDMKHIYHLVLLIKSAIALTAYLKKDFLNIHDVVII